MEKRTNKIILKGYKKAIKELEKDVKALREINKRDCEIGKDIAEKLEQAAREKKQLEEKLEIKEEALRKNEELRAILIQALNKKNSSKSTQEESTLKAIELLHKLPSFICYGSFTYELRIIKVEDYIYSIFYAYGEKEPKLRIGNNVAFEGGFEAIVQMMWNGLKEAKYV